MGDPIGAFNICLNRSQRKNNSHLILTARWKFTLKSLNKLGQFQSTVVTQTKKFPKMKLVKPILIPKTKLDQAFEPKLRC